MDHFANDRNRLAQAVDHLGDGALILGEWSSENVLGDPLLREAITAAAIAQGTALGALRLAQQALAKLPPVLTDGECYTLPNGECVAENCRLHGPMKEHG